MKKVEVARMSYAERAFAERFGVSVSLTEEMYVTYLGLYDTAYSAEVDGVVYTWSAAYGWYDEE